MALFHSFFKKCFIYLFDCAGSSLLQSFSVVMESSDYSLTVVPRLLNTVASLVAEQEGL